MSRNGSGVYSLPAGNPVVTNTTISSTWANSTLTDLATAMTGSVASDGQTPMTGPLNMNSNKITGVTAGTVAGDAVEFSQLVAASSTSVVITGGTINGTVIGGTNPVAGTFTTATATTVAATTGNITNVNASTFNTTNFHISESGGKLIFKYGTTTIASLDSSGNFVTIANITAYGTP
jgi:hypothetical protein